MHLYKLAVLLILNVVFVQAWYTTVVENGTTIVRTKSRSRSSTATSSSTTTTPNPTTTTSSSTTTTSAAVSSPTYTLDFYSDASCSGDILQSSDNDGCFVADIIYPSFSIDSTSSSELTVTLYYDNSCGDYFVVLPLSPNTCSEYAFGSAPIHSYSVKTA